MIAIIVREDDQGWWQVGALPERQVAEYRCLACRPLDDMRKKPAVSSRACPDRPDIRIMSKHRVYQFAPIHRLLSRVPDAAPDVGTLT